MAGELAVFFFWSAPVAFRRVALETPEWTSRDSNHHRQSVSAGKINAIPTEPSGCLIDRAVFPVLCFCLGGCFVVFCLFCFVLFVGSFSALHGDSLMDYVSIQFSSLLYAHCRHD